MKKILFLLLLLFSIKEINAQQGIGLTNPDASAAWEINSTNKGILFPRLTTVQMNAIASPATGLMIYNTDLQCIHYYNAGWKSQCDPANLGAWSLLGNNGTTDGTHFLGTTDNVPLNFKVNNQASGRIDGIGVTMFGFQTAENNTAATLSAFGFQALGKNTNGDFNTGIGYTALRDNQSGNANTAVGAAALFHNISGVYNTAIGREALFLNETGGSNTAIGGGALYNNNGGNNNIGIGLSTGVGNITGNNNIYIGTLAGAANVSGNYNLLLGENANVLSDGLDNAIAIGKNANVGASNSLVLGGTGTDAVKVGIGIDTPAYALDINSPSNPLRISGLQLGDIADSILTVSNSVVRTMKISDMLGNGFWNLDGNTVGAEKTIGTIDYYDLPFITNSLERMRITSDGNVGIGTVTPRGTLDVVGTNNTPINIMAHTSGGFAGATAAGVTIRAAMSGSGGGTGGNVLIASGAAGGGGGSAGNLILSSGLNNGGTGGHILFKYNDYGDFGSGTEAMRITNAGRIGIGLTSPSVRVQQDNGNATANYYKFTEGTTTGQLATDGFDLGADATGNAIIKQNEALPMIFSTSSTERMRINAAGNVGIGVTTPLARLHSTGTTGLDALYLNQNGNNHGLLVDHIGNAAVANGIRVNSQWGDSNGAIYINHTTTSSTGSGTPSKGMKILGTYLHTASTVGHNGEGLNIDVTNNAATTGTLYGQRLTATSNSAGSTVLGLGVTVASSSGTAYAATFSGGNVGVGTSTPTSTVQVEGSFATAIRTITATAGATVSRTDYTLLVNCTSGAITMTLPTASSCSGRTYIIKKLDAANTLTFSTPLILDLSQSISSTVMATTLTIQSDGTSWYIVNRF